MGTVLASDCEVSDSELGDNLMGVSSVACSICNLLGDQGEIKFEHDCTKLSSPVTVSNSVPDKQVSSCNVKKVEVNLNPDNESVIEKIVKASPSLYVAKKRIGYFAAFVKYLYCKSKGLKFEKPVMDVGYLNWSLDLAIISVQRRVFGPIFDLM